MAKWADYLISGIWRTTSNGSTHISSVFLHEDTDGDFKGGVKTSRVDVVKLLKAKKAIKTIQWNYHSGTWSMGADVSYITVNGVDYLRSHQDGTVNDNLDNLLRMDNFI